MAEKQLDFFDEIFPTIPNLIDVLHYSKPDETKLSRGLIINETDFEGEFPEEVYSKFLVVDNPNIFLDSIRAAQTNSEVAIGLSEAFCEYEEVEKFGLTSVECDAIFGNNPEVYNEWCERLSERFYGRWEDLDYGEEENEEGSIVTLYSLEGGGYISSTQLEALDYLKSLLPENASKQSQPETAEDDVIPF